MKQVLILNSGIGSRMAELTADRPKCLVELNHGETILGRQLSLLAELGLSNIIITTGPFEGKIRAYLDGRFGELHFTYINNPRYRDTNYIYSMLLTAGVVSSDVILIHGDLVFEREILFKLFNARHADAVLVDPLVALPDKDFKALIADGRVRQIGVDIFGPQAVSLQPLYKFSKESFAAWLAEIKRFVEAGNTQAYAENALNNLLGELNLYPVELADQFCMEVDNKRDLLAARSHLAKRGV